MQQHDGDLQLDPYSDANKHCNWMTSFQMGPIGPQAHDQRAQYQFCGRDVGDVAGSATRKKGRV